MLASSKNLPLAGINPLAFLLNRLDHLLSRNGVERARELAQHCPAFALRHGSSQRCHEAEDLLLHFGTQFVDLLHNLVSRLHLGSVPIVKDTPRDEIDARSE